MRYEISYEINGQSGSRFVVADSDESALSLFRAEWAQHGDEFNGSCWVSGRWSLVAGAIESCGDISDIAEILTGHGDRFSGNDAEEVAQEWADYDFSASTVDDWCEIGCWNPATAAELRDAGLTPRQVNDTAERMIDEYEEPSEEFTDGDPIYAACNNDISVARIINAAKQS